jgi:hypothetical protein
MRRDGLEEIVDTAHAGEFTAHGVERHCTPLALAGGCRLLAQAYSEHADDQRCT